MAQNKIENLEKEKKYLLKMKEEHDKCEKEIAKIKEETNEVKKNLEEIRQKNILKSKTERNNLTLKLKKN